MILGVLAFSALLSFTVSCRLLKLSYSRGLVLIVTEACVALISSNVTLFFLSPIGLDPTLLLILAPIIAVSEGLFGIYCSGRLLQLRCMDCLRFGILFVCVLGVAILPMLIVLCTLFPESWALNLRIAGLLLTPQII